MQFKNNIGLTLNIIIKFKIIVISTNVKGNLAIICTKFDTTRQRRHKYSKTRLFGCNFVWEGNEAK